MRLSCWPAPPIPLSTSPSLRKTGALVHADVYGKGEFIFETDQGERLLQEILRFLSEP